MIHDWSSPLWEAGCWSGVGTNRLSSSFVASVSSSTVGDCLWPATNALPGLVWMWTSRASDWAARLAIVSVVTIMWFTWLDGYIEVVSFFLFSLPGIWTHSNLYKKKFRSPKKFVLKKLKLESMLGPKFWVQNFLVYKNTFQNTKVEKLFEPENSRSKNIWSEKF